jgi:hypothetical protein
VAHGEVSDQLVIIPVVNSIFPQCHSKVGKATQGQYAILSEGRISVGEGTPEENMLKYKNTTYFGWCGYLVWQNEKIIGMHCIGANDYNYGFNFSSIPGWQNIFNKAAPTAKTNETAVKDVNQNARKGKRPAVEPEDESPGPSTS